MTDEYSEDEINEQRNNIIFYILNNSVSKLPIKHVDIVTKVLDKKTKLFNQCFPLARDALKENYGICLKEVTDSKDGKKYICYSDVYALSSAEYNKGQQQQLTLLFIVLSYIFLCGTAVSLNDLESFLAGLQIDFKSEHYYFGNVKELITETFVKQLYLKKTKSTSELDSETIYLMSWGFRSHVEFKKKLVLKAAATILGKPPNFFNEQFAEQCEEDEHSD